MAVAGSTGEGGPCLQTLLAPWRGLAGCCGKRDQPAIGLPHGGSSHAPAGKPPLCSRPLAACLANLPQDGGVCVCLGGPQSDFPAAPEDESIKASQCPRQASSVAAASPLLGGAPLCHSPPPIHQRAGPWRGSAE